MIKPPSRQRTTFLLPLLVLIPALSLAVSAAAQSAPTAAQKDPQAVSILQAYVAASGATAASLQDFTATGTVTYYWGGQQVQGPATVKGLGAANFRLDAQLPSGTRSIVAGTKGGSLTSPGGISTTIPLDHALKLISATWPLPIALAALSDPNTQLTYAGPVTFNGRAAYDIHVQEVYPSTADPSGKLGEDAARDLLVDAGTHLVVCMQDTTHPLRSTRRSYLHQLLYSDYQVVNGISVPFAIEDLISGQETWSLQLGSISLNTGLTAADFSL